MYSTQCVSLNVQCTSNTIQPESRIKKVETTKEKKKRELVTNEKVQERSWPRGGNITLKPWRETNVCVTDVLHVLQLCFLCFTLLKAMLLYHIFTGSSWVSHSHNPQSFSPLILSSFFSLSLTFFISITTPRAPPHSALVSSYILYPEALGCRRSFHLLNLPAVIDHKLNTESKSVGDVHATCIATPLFGFRCSFVPFLLMSLDLRSTPPPPLSCYQWCYSGTTVGGWGGRETVLSSSPGLFLNSTFHCPVVHHPSSPPPPLHQILHP